MTDMADHLSGRGDLKPAGRRHKRKVPLNYSTDSEGGEQDMGPVLVKGLGHEGKRWFYDTQRLRVVIGTRFRAAREALGVSQADLADAIGHENGTQLCLWESGQRMPNISTLVQAADLLGVSMDYLVGRTEEPELEHRAVRRNAMASTVKASTEVFATTLADVLLNGGADVEGVMRGVSLLTKVEALATAVHRMQAANEDVFNDLKGGAWVLRSASEVAEAAAQVDEVMTATAAERLRAHERLAASIRDIATA
jgi:transcriptional regulator with XRE-family HTH domain